MHCEIEFLPIGYGEKAGDAIILRCGDATNYKLMLIDGGHEATGDNIVAHLRQHFGPHARLEHVVLTHSDADYASGLRTVMRTIPIENLWLHIPWNLADQFRHLFAGKRWTAAGLDAYIKKEYDIVSEIVDPAIAQDTRILCPFEGERIDPFLVCSPSR